MDEDDEPGGPLPGFLLLTVQRRTAHRMGLKREISAGIVSLV
jgi:hypothetical protein